VSEEDGVIGNRTVEQFGVANAVNLEQFKVAIIGGGLAGMFASWRDSPASRVAHSARFLESPVTPMIQ